MSTWVTVRRTPAACALGALIVGFAACGSGGVHLPAADLPVEPIMASSRLHAAHLADWFDARTPRPAGTYAAGVPVRELAHLFVDEGHAEGVTGDVAFLQAIVETGWFRFTGRVPASANNFGGIGATDGADAARFPDARSGVRAHIQHLRAYADPTATTCTTPPLRRPCADPRFHLVLPKGRARTWNELGGGNWAQARDYAVQILRLNIEARDFHRAR